VIAISLMNYVVLSVLAVQRCWAWRCRRAVAVPCTSAPARQHSCTRSTPAPGFIG